MMRRSWLDHARVCGLAFAGAAAFAISAAPANAQIVQVTRADAKHSIGFNLGYFMLKDMADRVDGDIFREDRIVLETEGDGTFDVGRFNGFNVGGEWLYAVGDFLETGVGLDLYQRTVTSRYRDITHADGADIFQDLKLRVVPITATVRFLPIGRSAAVQPYVGAGIGFFNWSYTEDGEFVDFSDDTIFVETYKANGTAVGPVIVGGIRFPVGDAFTTGFEYRWRKAEGDIDRVESGLPADKIDLGGQSVAWTFHLRF
jgi:Outer membrane protein beta-barrel domain